MQCISIFTLMICAVCANQILGNKILILLHESVQFGSFLPNSAVPEIQTNPSSLLVPIGTKAVFECKVRHCPETCSIYWTINGTSIVHNHQQDRHEDLGFTFEDQHNTTTNVFYSKLAITASVSINNTQFYCVVQDGINPPRRSDQAILIVVSGIYLSGCMQWYIMMFYI